MCDVLMTSGLCIDLESFILVLYVTADRLFLLKKLVHSLKFAAICLTYRPSYLC